ncbi:MAG: thioredoxin domain-containing protein [Muribaculum sp.]|nr:thioredoxin domain-containing protein [Muribaculum sp.]
MKINSFILNTVTIGLWLIVTACSSGQSKATDSLSDSQSAGSFAESHSNPSSLADNAEYKLINNRIIPINGRPAVVDFYADWCPPCRKLHPIFTSIAQDFEGMVDFIRVDVDAKESLAQEYVGRGIPTLVFLLPNGDVAATTEGFMTEPELRSCVEELIEKTHNISHQ